MNNMNKEDNIRSDLLILREIADNLEAMMSEDSANYYRKYFDRTIKYCLHDSISKDKIKAKIKEINNRRIEDGQCELALHGFQREAKIDVLKELLEEE